MTVTDTEPLISPPATNPMPDPCSTWKQLSPSNIVLLTNWLQSKNRMIRTARFRSFAFNMAAIFARCWFSPTTKKSLTSAVMSLSIDPSTNFPIRSWNSSMCLSRDSTRLSFQATYLPRRPTNSLLPSGFDLSRCTVCLQVCVQMCNYPFPTKPRNVKKFLLQFSGLFVEADRLCQRPQGLRQALTIAM